MLRLKNLEVRDKLMIIKDLVIKLNTSYSIKDIDELEAYGISAILSNGERQHCN